jgi:hypothetical protein
VVDLPLIPQLFGCPVPLQPRLALHDLHTVAGLGRTLAVAVHGQACRGVQRVGRELDHEHALGDRAGTRFDWFGTNRAIFAIACL